MTMISMRSIAYSVLLLGLVAAEGPVWTVYHSWDGSQDYTKRGVLEWSSEEESIIVKNDEAVLSPESVQAMLEYGWYHVKVENPGGDFVMATVPACNLRRANFKDEFQIIVPRTSEHITSFAYNPLVSPLAPETCEELPTPEAPTLSSRASIGLDTPGMVLRTILPNNKPAPGLKFMANPNSKRSKTGAGEAGPGGDPNAEDAKPPNFVNDFLLKYWYILLPLFIMNFLVPPEEPAAQGSAPAQGGAAAPAGGAPAPAPAPAAAASASSKRSKRSKRG